VFFFVLEWFGNTIKNAKNGSKRNSEHFFFRAIVLNEITKFQVFFSSTKWFGTELRAFLSSAEWLGPEFQAFFGMNQNFRPFSVPQNNFFLGKWQP
jgi:hypothetical protein